MSPETQTNVSDVPEVQLYKWHTPYQVPPARMDVPAVTKSGASSGKYEPKASLIKSARWMRESHAVADAVVQL